MRAYFIFNRNKLIAKKYKGSILRVILNPLEYRKLRRYAISIIENVDTMNGMHRYNTVNLFGLYTMVVRNYSRTVIFMTKNPDRYSYRAVVRDFLTPK